MILVRSQLPVRNALVEKLPVRLPGRRTLSILTLIMVILFLGGLTGCADKASSTSLATTPAAASSATTATLAATPTPMPSPTASPTPTPLPTPTPTPTPPLNALTGLPLNHPKDAGTRPVAIMINNLKAATPQTGITSADLFFEMVVEGGITRMMAVFADVKDVPEIGAIRSLRHDYIDFAGSLDAVVVHFGGSDIAYSQLRSQGTPHIDGMTSSALWRDAVWARTRGSVHSVKTSGKKLAAAIQSAGLRTTSKNGSKLLFKFQPDEVLVAAAGKKATKVTVPFSNYVTAVFKYEAASGLYTKSQFGSLQIDEANDQPLRFANVLLLKTSIYVADSRGHMDANLTSGKGYYIAGGKIESITWKKGSTKAKFVFKRSDGSTLALNRGKTYIGIVSNRRNITWK